MMRHATSPRTASGLLAPSLLAAALLAMPVALAGQEAGAPAMPATDGAPPPVETRIVVRALSNDAKLIGSGVGGARVTIRHADSGAILAEGVQEGGTGDTEAILAPRNRDGTPFDTEGAAAFRTSLPLDRPTPVEITVEGPLGTPHAGQRTSTTLLLLPGHHVEGDGVVLVLHGFTVEIVEAATAAAPGTTLPIRAKVTMLCGCPTEPGGRWDSSGWVMEAALVARPDRDGGPERTVAAVPLHFAGETSMYEARLAVPDAIEEGTLTLRVTAVDTERVNAGMAERSVRIRR